ncbi:hypothetical protein, conserved [Eimeria necatrix]|uniref:Uncharacterized protein n=1 Tax=Eimeria necatrix TaxID=51315 RepID=U6N8P4_9EIME|nr:hypothetical protein, conserved [Eimeria necatrix]CDJ70241.1 hypothetical protein, conserved [Eimeria necatrix]
MNLLLTWPLLAAAAEAAGGLASGSIGLTEQTLESEVSENSTEGYGRAFLDDKLWLLGDSPITFTSNFGEAGLEGYDLSASSANIHCSTCTTPVEDQHSSQPSINAQKEQAAGTEVLAREEMTTGSPIRGIKSLVTGSLMLGLLLILLSAPEDSDDESHILTRLHDSLADDIVDGLFAVDDFLEAHVPIFPFWIVTFWVLTGAAPILFFSGLVDLTQSLRKRRHTPNSLANSKPTGFPFGFLVTSLAILALSLPANQDSDNPTHAVAMEACVNLIWGMNLVFLLRLLTRARGWKGQGKEQAHLLEKANHETSSHTFPQEESLSVKGHMARH